MQGKRAYVTLDHFPAVATAILFLGVTTTALTLIARAKSMPHPVLVAALVSLVGHVLIGLVLFETGSVADSDAMAYHRDAIQASRFLTGDEAVAPEMTAGKQGWVWTLASVYTVGGEAQPLGTVINSCLLSFIPLVMAGVMRSLGRPEAQSLAAWLSLASMSQWFWGSLPIREGGVTLCLALIALGMVQASVKDKLAPWLLIGLAMLGLLAYRGSMAVLLGGVIMLMILIQTIMRFGKGPIRPAKAVVALIAFVLAQFSLGYAGGDLDADRADVIRNSQAKASTGFDVDTAGGSLTDQVGAALSAFPRVSVGPYPWNLNGSLIYVLPDLLIWWTFVFMAVRLLMRDWRSTAVLSLVVPLIGLLLALAAYSGNYGTVIRLRSQGFVFLVPLVALYLVDRAARRPGQRSGRVMGATDRPAANQAKG